MTIGKSSCGDFFTFNGVKTNYSYNAYFTPKTKYTFDRSEIWQHQETKVCVIILLECSPEEKKSDGSKTARKVAKVSGPIVENDSTLINCIKTAGRYRFHFSPHQLKIDETINHFALFVQYSLLAQKIYRSPSKEGEIHFMERDYTYLVPDWLKTIKKSPVQKPTHPHVKSDAQWEALSTEITASEGPVEEGTAKEGTVKKNEGVVTKSVDSRKGNPTKVCVIL